jgi:P-type conjugative transfer protein TrbJ
MTRVHRKKAFSAIFIALITCFSPIEWPARAVPGIYATEITQLANKLQLLLSYIRQGQQLASELQMLEDMLKNSKAVPYEVFSPVISDIARLNTIVETGQALAYSMANIDGQFRTTFPGYATFMPKQWYRNYQTWSNRSLDTTLGTLRAAGLQASQMASEGAVLDQLRVMAKSSDGRLLALQVANQVAHEQVDQLMKLRQLMLADLQSKQAYQAMMIQQNASKQAAAEQFFTFTGVTGDGVTFVPGK